MPPAPTLRTDAWLMRGLGTLPGRLALAHGRLSFTAHGAGTLWPFQLRRLAQAAGRPALAEALEAGRAAVVFDVSLAAVARVHVPWYYFSGGLIVTTGAGARYRLGFARPVNTAAAAEPGDLFGEVARARRAGKAWRQALSGLSAQR